MESLVLERSEVVPFSLKWAPALIERLLPVNRLSAECYKERKAGSGQTLTSLGGFWKGRKPLILVRAAVLASLLPATGDDAKDLDIFLKLLGMDDESFARRIKAISASDIDPGWELYGDLIETNPRGVPAWRRDVDQDGRRRLIAQYILTLPYSFDGRLRYSRRPEECDTSLHDGIWDEVNAHLGTSAESVDELVEQLGVMRFGRRPKVGDTFSGGGSIPFEAARSGCNVVATDLNPLACVLTWGGLNIIGAEPAEKARLEEARVAVIQAVDDEITALGIEHDGDDSYLRLPYRARAMGADEWKISKDGVTPPASPPFEALCPWSGWRVPLLSSRIVNRRKRAVLRLVPLPSEKRYRIDVEEGADDDTLNESAAGTVIQRGRRLFLVHAPLGTALEVPIANRAKAHLCCVEVKCPRTGWMVPVAPSWVVSRTRNVIAELVSDHNAKRYQISVRSGVSAKEIEAADKGTFRGGRIVHPMNPDQHGVSIDTLRAAALDVPGGGFENLRRWSADDVRPAPNDLFQERIYCIQWSMPEVLSRQPEIYFSEYTEEDDRRENLIIRTIDEAWLEWRRNGIIPIAPIEAGEKTNEPIRTRGWTHWHHLFHPRSLVAIAEFRKRAFAMEDSLRPALEIDLCQIVDNACRLCTWNTGHPGSGEYTAHVFYNQALNTSYSYSTRSVVHICNSLLGEHPASAIAQKFTIQPISAQKVQEPCDIFITDPPYADAIVYHEITEFFIAWLMTNPPEAFKSWTWDSRRSLAIQGQDEHFRRAMVEAYGNMTDCMPDNGLQIIMFTHQNPGVWADLAAITWASGLRVSSAWNVVTETDAPHRKGNYVQGTILLALRKRTTDGNAKRVDIEIEIEEAVKEQMDILNAVGEDSAGGRMYTDGDLLLAAYASALRVITGYRTIDRRDVGADVYRQLARGEKSVIRELIDYASSVANNLLIPDGCPPRLWGSLGAEERFYFRMLDIESKGGAKVADFQAFARSYGVDDYKALMSSTAANKARLARALDLKGKDLGVSAWGTSLTRHVLFAVWKIYEKDDNPKEGINYLTTTFRADNYAKNKPSILDIAAFVRDRNRHVRPDESKAADLLVEGLRLKMDRI